MPSKLKAFYLYHEKGQMIKSTFCQWSLPRLEHTRLVSEAGGSATLELSKGLEF